MKFLNHLDLVENEARRLKMYRVAASAYTPSITSSGNIIMDTAAAIPKWWDGTAWRDFSYNTTGGVNTTYTYAVPASTTKLRLTGSDSTTNDIEIAAGTGFMSVVRTNANKLTINNETYNIGISTPTTAVSGKNVAIDLGRSSGSVVDEVGIQDGTYITNSIVNTGTFKGDLSAVDGTAGEAERVLAKSNKWITIASINTNTQNTYSTSIPSSTTKLRLSGAGAAGNTTDDIEFVGSGATSVTRTNDSKFTISSTNTQYTGTVSTGITLTGTVFTVNTWNQISLATSGSTQGETAGRYYRVGTDTAGKLIVNVPWVNTNTNTTYTAGTGMTLNSTTFNVNTWGAISGTLNAAQGETSGKWYKVNTDSNDKLVVNVPWQNTQTTNTDANYALSVGAVSSNESTLSLVGSSGGSTTTAKFSGTTNEIEITTPATGNAGDITIGLPNDVTIGNDLAVTNDLTVTGDLTVNGTTTTIDTTQLVIEDNLITLNKNQTGTPSTTLTSGIEVERGTPTNSSLHWVEQTDKWVANDGSNSYNIIQNVFTTATGNSGTATANSYTTALAVTGTAGITTTASGQAISISGGTGMTPSKVATISSTSINSSTNKKATITHNLATKDVVVRLYEIQGEGAYNEIYADVSATTTNACTVQFSANLSVSVRAVIIAAKYAGSVTPTYS